VHEFRPDAALVSMFEMYLSPAVLEALRGVPTALVVHYYKPICPNGLKLLPDESICRVRPGLVCWRGGCQSLALWTRDRVRYRLIRRVLGQVDRVLTVSDAMMATLRANDVEAERVDLPVPPPDGAVARAPHPSPTFVFNGRHAPEKGGSVLLHAFAGLRETFPDARLRMLGDGPERPMLEKLARRLDLGSSVRFVGRLGPEAHERELGEAWAVVAPSLWAEPLGLVAVEAIVRGIPVIASREGGFAEVVDDGRSGLLVANGDAKALAAALHEVASRRAFPTLAVAADLVERTRRRHDLDRHLRALGSIFEEMVGSTSGRCEPA